MISLNKVAAGSFIAGFKDVGIATASVVIPTKVMLANQDLGTVASVVMAMPSVNLLPIMRIQLSGSAGISSSLYYAFMGNTVICDNGVALNFTSTGSTAGRTISIGMYNLTAGGKTYPAGTTANFYAHLYSYPWA